jgi:hypothetical protein
MKVKTFDNKFDDRQDVSNALDLSKAKRPNQEQKRVNVDLPTWSTRIVKSATSFCF